jgi:aryl-alcohol dehydrogenase-like predicted oxidoreductase
MQTTQLGSTGPRTSRMGLGCMGMSDLYGPANLLLRTIRQPGRPY